MRAPQKIFLKGKGNSLGGVKENVTKHSFLIFLLFVDDAEYAILNNLVLEFLPVECKRFAISYH